jgi:hypothetical protein
MGNGSNCRSDFLLIVSSGKAMDAAENGLGKSGPPGELDEHDNNAIRTFATIWEPTLSHR